jgi:transposase
VVPAASSVNFPEGLPGRAAKWEPMARQAPQIVLSGEERAELERRAACYTLPHKVVQRAKLVLYAADGLTNVEIASRLDSAPEVVGRWRSRVARERIAGLEDRARSGRPRRFPPQEVAQVKAVACELATEAGVPLSRFSRAELHRLVIEQGVTEASASTIARWLSEDAIKPWQHRS